MRILQTIAIVLCLALVSCQATTRMMGGTTELELEPGQELVTITWKESTIWYLVRDRYPNEKADTLYFKSQASFGPEGVVVIYER